MKIITKRVLQHPHEYYDNCERGKYLSQPFPGKQKHTFITDRNGKWYDRITQEQVHI
jgi:hypothetical protein